MLQRFVAGTAIASVAIAVGAFIVFLFPRLYPLTMIWCFAPALWGLWAMLAPPKWVPSRLPVWGAILGLIAGTLAAFVLDLPSQLLREAVPAGVRALGVAAVIAFYYLLWTIVRTLYRSLVTGRPAIQPPGEPKARAASAAAGR